VCLQGIIILLFEKALDEPNFCAMYASVCQRLAADGPDFEPLNEDGSKAKTPTFLKVRP
jgi:translation initiation factor 4G